MQKRLPVKRGNMMALISRDAGEKVFVADKSLHHSLTAKVRALCQPRQHELEPFSCLQRPLMTRNRHARRYVDCRQMEMSARAVAERSMRSRSGPKCRLTKGEP